MRYGSVCSGIEAATAAWHHMGWEPAFFSEIEKFPRAVLEHHYPEVPLHGDFTTIEQNQYGKIDLLVGGTPCQSFSIAGLRGGLDDERGNLALEFCRLAQREQPRWIVWENVPGVLSSGGGRDFGSILGALEDLGYGLAYRVLDAQYFGVAQRRRRVFVVGYLGDWRPAAAVLFERNSMSGHPAPSREARKEAARAAAGGTYACGGTGEYRSSSSSSPLLRTGADYGHGGEALIVGGGRLGSCVDVAPTLNAGGNKTGGDRPYGTSVDTCDSLIAFDTTQVTSPANYSSPQPGEALIAFAPAVANAITASMAHAATGHNKDENVIAFDVYNQSETPQVSKTVAARNDQDTASCIAFDTTQITSAANYSSPQPGDPCHPLVAHAHAPAIAIQAGAMRENPASGPDGVGVQEGISYTLEARAEVQAVAFPIDTQNMAEGHNSGGKGFGGGHLDPSFTLTKGHSHAVAFQSRIARNGRGQPEEICPTLNGSDAGATSDMRPLVAFAQNQRDEVRTLDVAGALAAEPGMKQQTYLADTWAVRRLTPTECERLQGFPDNYTAIPWGKKTADECPDGPRYKVIGNSMAVPVMRWIGERIQLVDDFISLF